uniref:Uncharacterized protein n=1 Tax=Panagrolaimus sp. PS1159 TaxID=55785 RepID=A0AC35F8H4_9BILA
MNLYFVIRILSLISIIIGSFLVTFSVWAIYARYCSMYYTVLNVDYSFIDYFSPQYYKCNSTEWSEWSSCNKTIETRSKRYRKNAACIRITDSKPCMCSMDGLCDDITLIVNNKMDFDCIESAQILNSTKPFLIQGSSGACSINSNNT